MKVENVTGLTVHLKKGHITFGKDEINVSVVETEVYNSDKTVLTPVEYYIITTTPIERVLPSGDDD